MAEYFTYGPLTTPSLLSQESRWCCLRENLLAVAWKLEPPPSCRGSEFQDTLYVCLDFSVEWVFVRLTVVQGGWAPRADRCETRVWRERRLCGVRCTHTEKARSLHVSTVGGCNSSCQCLATSPLFVSAA